MEDLTTQRGDPTLERFRAKWIPVRVKKTRQNKELDHFTVSVKQ
jgi:hypothetical protein